MITGDDVEINEDGSLTFTVSMSPCLACRLLTGPLSKQQYSRYQSAFVSETGGLCASCEVNFSLDPLTFSLIHDGLSLVD